MKIRFIKRFVLFSTETYEEGNRLKTRQLQHHIKFGRIYPIENYEDKGGVASFEFVGNNKVRGTVIDLNKEYFEIVAKPGMHRPGGCGGCRERRK